MYSCLTFLQYYFLALIYTRLHCCCASKEAYTLGVKEATLLLDSSMGLSVGSGYFLKKNHDFGLHWSGEVLLLMSRIGNRHLLWITWKGGWMYTILPIKM